MDIDIDLDPELARLQAGTAALNALPSAMEPDTENTVADLDAMVEDGEVEASEAVANKVNISGLHNLTTTDVENFAHDNYKAKGHVKIEWVNDESANIVYDTNATAAEALQAFSVTIPDDPLEPRRAQNLLTHPEAELYVRQALVTDVKVRGAAIQSRFYLDHPEYDPEYKSRGRGRGRGGGRGGGRSRGSYRRTGGQEDDLMDRSRRRSSAAEGSFNVDMYDDVKRDAAPTGPRAGRRGSNMSGEDLITDRQGGRRAERTVGDLIGDRRDGRLRDRSASPIREGDGRYGFSDEQPYRQTARHRTPPPARKRSLPDNRSASKAIRADLFANRSRSSALQNGNGKKTPIELFPARASNDLFPDLISKKRQADGLRPADITSAIGKCKLNGEIDDKFTYANDEPVRPRASRNADRNGGDLITHSSSNHGRLTDDFDDGTSFSIKGAGSATAKGDFSILGASSGRSRGNASGGRRDLFEGNRSGRFGQRLSRS